MCVCVCECVRERGRERERGKNWTHDLSLTQKQNLTPTYSLNHDKENNFENSVYQLCENNYSYKKIKEKQKDIRTTVTGRVSSPESRWVLKGN